MIVYDIETIKGYFLFVSYDLGKNKWNEFSICRSKNEIFNLLNYLESNKTRKFVGFNNLNFDGQVIEYIWRNNNSWVDLKNTEISAIIHQYASDLIGDINYGKFPTYHEETLTFKQVDLFKIAHYDNKNRMVGLKRLEYEMDMDNVEEMPVAPDKEHFSSVDEQNLVHYCYHDVKATILFYKHLTGDVEHELYKGTNELEIREVLSETFGFDCTNYSNSKYGDEIVKKLYAERVGIDISNLPKKGTFRKILKFSSGIPDYIEFKTAPLKSFLEQMRKKQITPSEEFEQKVYIGNQIHTFALGGLHNEIDGKQYFSDEEYLLLDVDVTGYYVATIINNEYAPKHLNGKYFVGAYSWIYNERTKLKPLAKSDKKIKGIVAGYKEAGVSVYGKLGDRTNWMYDPQARLNVCIAGELSILMLIEDHELDGSKCIMSNTDGAMFIVKRKNLDNFYKICKDWCEKTKYALEFAPFKSIHFLNVNNYLGVKEDGEIKYKGIFCQDSFLHKNKSNRVIALALRANILNNIDVTEFIMNHNNIYDFCGRSSAGNTFYHAIKDGKSKASKLIRYYVAKEGYTIMKMVKEGNLTGANDTNVKPAEEPKVILNKIENVEYHLGNIKKEWYISEVNKVLYRLGTGKKLKQVQNNPNQMNLF